MRLTVKILVVAFIMLIIFVPNQPETGTGLAYRSPSAQGSMNQVDFWWTAYKLVEASYNFLFFFAALTLQLLNGVWEVAPPGLRVVLGLFFAVFNILAFIGLCAILGADRIFQRLF